MQDDQLVAEISAGRKLRADDTLPAGYRTEVMRLMAVFVDSELAGAAGFTPFINHAPGVRERAHAARMVSEKFGHAERVLGLMVKFGVDADLYVRSHPWEARLDRTLDLGNRRVGSDKRLNVFYYPLEGWIDAVILNFLMGTATAVQLAELIGCSYEPLSTAMAEITPREESHARHGEKGLKLLVEREGSSLPAQLAVAYWFPRVQATFGRLDSDRFELYRRYGLRRRPNAEMLHRWRGDVSKRLAAIGLAAPGF